MSQVETLTAQLAQAVLQSPEYRDYLKYKEILKRDADLYRSVNELRKYNFDLQNNIDMGDAFDVTENLRIKYMEIRKLPQVSDFLMAEMSLGRMIQDIYRGVVKDLEFEFDFL